MPHDVGPEDWRPGPAYYLAKAHVEKTGRLVIVTCRAHRWRPQIEAWAKKDLVGEKSYVEVHTAGRWIGWRHAVKWKTSRLRALRVTWYCGDQDHLDGAAARAIGAVYYDVRELIPEVGIGGHA